MFKLKDRVKIIINRSEQNPKWETVHDGYVIQLGSHFLKVWSAKMEHDSLVNPEDAEWFPILGKRIKILPF